MNASLQNKSHFNSLTGVRAIAALLVYLHHFHPKGCPVLIDKILSEFHVGVTFFFVLSGFLISYKYADQEQLFSYKSLVKYFRNRIARIYPMFFIITLLTFIADHNYSKIQWIFNFTLIKGFFDTYKFTGIPQGWTLTVEETFYLLAPVIFFLRRRVYLFLMPVVLICFGIVMVKIFSTRDFYGFFSSYTFMFICTFFGRCLEFFAGIKLAFLLKEKREKKMGINFTFWGLLLIGIAIAGLALVPVVFSNEKLINGVQHPAGIFINNAILPVFICLFYWGIIHEKNIIQKILSSRVFVILGKSSYIFYLIHLGIVNTLINNYISTNQFISFLMLNFVSITLFYLVEEPLNRLIRNKISF